MGNHVPRGQSSSPHGRCNIILTTSLCLCGGETGATPSPKGHASCPQEGDKLTKGVPGCDDCGGHSNRLVERVSRVCRVHLLASVLGGSDGPDPASCPHSSAPPGVPAKCSSSRLFSVAAQTRSRAACVSAAAPPHWFLSRLVQAARFSVYCRTDFRNLCEN